MMSIPQALASALQHFHGGRLQEAEQLLQQALQADPDHADALHLLGIIAVQTRRADLAVDYFRRVLRRRPNFPAAHNNLGMALHAQGNFDEAVLSYREAVRLRPDFAEAHSNLGRTLQRQGKLTEAVESYRQALRVQPDSAGWHYNLGTVLLQLGRFAEALESLQKAVHLRPDTAEPLNRLGDALQLQGKLAEAVNCYRDALLLKPDFAEAHVNLAVALHTQGKRAEAVDSYQESLRLNSDAAKAMNPVVAVHLQGQLAETAAREILRQRPDSLDAHMSLATALQMQGKLDEAVASYEQALRLRPDHAGVHNDLGNTLRALGRTTDAVRHFEEALRLKPDTPESHLGLAAALQDQGKLDEVAIHLDQALHLRPTFAEAHCNKGILELLQGRLVQGWPELEWRWRLKGRWARPLPRWDGGSLAGKTILLCAEQGLGDTLQFIRYASLVKERGATVVVECQPALLSLLAGCPGIDRLVPEGCPVPECELQAALFSLPGLCGTTLANIPTKVPYLAADSSRVAFWRERLANHSGFKVGICWQGSPYHKNDRQRSLPLAAFAPLARVPGVRLISLQKGHGTEQIRDVDFEVIDFGDKLGEGGEFVDTAALMETLDLVITVDTAAAHLAGALGVPVWVALPFAPDWRWLREREDSPWYPSMRLFRQKHPGDWSGVFQMVKEELRTKRIR